MLTYKLTRIDGTERIETEAFSYVKDPWTEDCYYETWRLDTEKMDFFEFSELMAQRYDKGWLDSERADSFVELSADETGEEEAEIITYGRLVNKSQYE